ncbi:(S)-ureidoglycine aminohydrolase [Forsythia ovata]|uniref:(S)-ureidoglycine aminohydrolase n=1 Tax=Forsythia ovata TaxID=205694 RepID=A0ABD1TM15_9LAMI
MLMSVILDNEALDDFCFNTLMLTTPSYLPGFTRSVYNRDHALITPESHVFSPLPDWVNTMGAYLITPAMGSHFIMYLSNMQENSKSGLPPIDVERFVFVLQGTVTLIDVSDISHKLEVDSYAYLPLNSKHSLKSDASATLVVFEKRYEYLENYIAEHIVFSTDKHPLLETPGEVFELRKLLPTSLPYDFNIHTKVKMNYKFSNVGIYCKNLVVVLESWIANSVILLCELPASLTASFAICFHLLAFLLISFPFSSCITSFILPAISSFVSMLPVSSSYHNVLENTPLPGEPILEAGNTNSL